MFQKEKNGLETIAQTKTISTPKIYACDSFNNDAFLLMEYIESKAPYNNDFKTLGFKLAELHKNTAHEFGLKEDNFIGSLFQSNKQNSSWVYFYIYERLSPQLQLAEKKGLLSEDECPSELIMKEKLEYLFQDVKPSLLHGDLWNGNYLISKQGIPYLIDPAIYYGHYEVDLAMSKLFGGFGDDFYKAYYSIHPIDTKTTIRIEIYQLYYLLVHLNLFGKSYYSSVKNSLNNFF
jgi:fructosamine-3-kinase